MPRGVRCVGSFVSRFARWPPHSPAAPEGIGKFGSRVYESAEEAEGPGVSDLSQGHEG